MYQHQEVDNRHNLATLGVRRERFHSLDSFHLATGSKCKTAFYLFASVINLEPGLQHQFN